VSVVDCCSSWASFMASSTPSLIWRAGSGVVRGLGCLHASQCCQQMIEFAGQQPATELRIAARQHQFVIRDFVVRDFVGFHVDRASSAAGAAPLTTFLPLSRLSLRYAALAPRAATGELKAGLGQMALNGSRRRIIHRASASRWHFCSAPHA